MRLTVFFLPLLFLFTLIQSYSYPGYRLLYKEQLYELYHEHLYKYPENYAENILWLEQVLRVDFANPLNALAGIKTKEDYEWYKNHFLMHVNLLLLKQYLGWASGYMKFDAYFYNVAFRDMTIRSMEKAKQLVEYSRVYWDEALRYYNNIVEMKKNNKKLYFFSLPKIQNWEDEAYKIQKRKLDYTKIIDRELERIDRVSAELLAF